MATSNWSTVGKHCAVLRDMSRSRTTCLEGELFNEGRILIKVAVTNPRRPDHEIRDAGPAHVAAAFWPSGEIHFLVVRKRGSLGLVRLALVLHRDFACPPNHERTTGIRHQILKLARTLDGIEDDLQFGSHGDSHEGRLRAATGRKGPQHPKFLFCNELVDFRFCHVQGFPKELQGLSFFSGWSPPRSDDWRESALLVCQNYQRSKCRRFLILGPGRSERTTKGRNLLPHPIRRFAERCLDTFVEVTLSKPGDRKV
jgi:hypothetical protein